MIGILLTPEPWYVLGFTLIVLDLVIGLDFFALSAGIGAIITGLLLDIVTPVTDALIDAGSWEPVILVFVLISIALIFPVRKAASRLYGKEEAITDD